MKKFCFLLFIFSLSVVLLTAGNFAPPPAATPTPTQVPLSFRWPLEDVTKSKIVQDYACKGEPGVTLGSCYYRDKYHTGLDLRLIDQKDTDAVPVYATEAGTVITVKTDCKSGIYCGRGFGNYIIVRHAENIYSLYAHLNETNGVMVKAGDVVKKGQGIGEMGNTGSKDNSAHLHFELRNFKELGFGYSAAHPAYNGYYDPWIMFSETKIMPLSVGAKDHLGIIYRGPDFADLKYTSFSQITYKQAYVASAYVKGWYRIHLPCKNSSCAGWIPETEVTKLASATQLEIKDKVLFTLIRATPEWNGTPLEKIWKSQWLAATGNVKKANNCPGQWREVYIPKTDNLETGWICGDYVIVHEIGR